MNLAEPRIDIFLRPGEYWVGDAQYRVRTTLGSCVAVTLWHPQRRIGAMSHFLLAKRERAGAEQLDGRYGDECIELMVGDLERLGVRHQECEAKIFGGGNMFPEKAGKCRFEIGRKNGVAATALLEQRGMLIRSVNLYGEGHRNVIFDPQSGDVWVRQIAVRDATKAGEAVPA